MAEYDTVSKDLIQTYPNDFIRLTLEQDDVEVLDILNTEQSTVDTRYADSLIRVQIAGQEALVHHEFQTTDDASMPLRMAGYMIRAMEQHGPAGFFECDLFAAQCGSARSRVLCPGFSRPSRFDRIHSDSAE